MLLERGPQGLANLRPITLIDAGRKWFSTVLTCRLIEIVEGHGLLKGDNFGCSPGVQYLDAVHCICEHAVLQKKNLFIVSLDIKSAFDSVPFDSLRASMRRLQIPDNFTDNGLSPTFCPLKGIEQGEINAPLLGASMDDGETEWHTGKFKMPVWSAKPGISL